jgi:hypothetical protein
MNMPMRRFLHLFAGLLLVAGAGALSAADMNKTLRVAFPVDITGFDPQVTQDLYSGYVERSIFYTLFVYDHLARPYQLVPAARDHGRQAHRRRPPQAQHRHADPAFQGKPRAGRRRLCLRLEAHHRSAVVPEPVYFRGPADRRRELIAAAKSEVRLRRKAEGCKAGFARCRSLKNPDYGSSTMTTTQLAAVARSDPGAWRDGNTDTTIRSAPGHTCSSSSAALVRGQPRLSRCRLPIGATRRRADQGVQRGASCRWWAASSVYHRGVDSAPAGLQVEE